MECPVCATRNPDASMQCGTCHTPFPVNSSQETLHEGGAPKAWSVAVTSQTLGVAPAGDDLEKGTVLAGRYEIIALLGRGGMGAVYKARDFELDRFVALKLIRPELARNPEILRRFKQELILARQVTHKNVIRIFDLGQSDGIKFITMDFVEGQNLRELLLERGKFPAEQAARVMLQICRALEAAHTEGVIHRDLKPQNVMLSPDGRVYVMDFGMSALEIEPEKRLSSAREMAQQLEIWLGPSAGSSTIFLPAPGAPAYWKWASGALGVSLVAALVVFRVWGPSKPAPAHAPVSVLVADFANTTGDSVFDETLEPPLSVALEGASFISSYNRGQAKKIAAQVRPGTGLEESTARLVGDREGINFIVSGLIAKKGSGYVVSARALQNATGRLVMETKEDAADKKDVLSVIGKIAAQTRRALGDTTPEALQIAAAETYTTQSLEAAHDYALAQDLQWQGKWNEAIQHYLQAVQFDSNFGRAYAGLAAVSANIGQQREAQKYYQAAMTHLDRMSDREKYRTRGGYYLLMREPQKAVGELSSLVKQFPSDSAGAANLALAYELNHDLPHAVEDARHAVDISPHNVPQRNNLGLFATYNGDFESGIREQQAVLQMNPSFVLAYVGLAMSQLGKGQVEDAKKTYEKLERIDARGASSAADGLADLALFENRTADAVAILDSAMAIDLKDKNLDAAGNKLAMLGNTQLASGHSAAARAAAGKAVASSQDISVLFWASRVYTALGEDSKSLALAKQLAGQLQPDPQAYAKLIQGEAALKKGNAREAIGLFQQAQKDADTWIGHFDSGRAYLTAGAFPEADSEFEICLKRRGEAASAFLDEQPTYRLFPTLYYYLGRAQEGMKTPAATDSYKTFAAIWEKGNADPLLEDTRRRLAIH